MTDQAVFEVARAGAALVRSLQQRGYVLDGSPASLVEIDRFLDREAPGGVPRTGSVLDTDLADAALAVGGYVGRVLVSHGHGAWRVDPYAPADASSVSVVMPDGSVHRVVRLVLARLSPDTVGRSFAGLARQHTLGAMIPAQPRRRMLARLLA